MKTTQTIFLILLTSFLISSCIKDPNHSIRVKNKYRETVRNLRIGSVSVGTVNSGSTSDYVPVDEGSHSLSGSTPSGMSLTGSVSLKGKGTHKWTMSILSSGGLEIKED